MTKTLITRHNAGFFSCCTLRLLDIIQYFNRNKELPEVVDSSEQFVFYKSKEGDLTPLLFETDNIDIRYEKDIVVTHEPREITFSDYSKIHFDEVDPFVRKYFLPSWDVRMICENYVNKYSIDFSNTCAVFYRGNDKSKECEVTSHQDFIDKAKELLYANPDIRFLVQPDETEFLEAFTAEFPGRCVWFEETPHMRKKDSAIFFELPLEKKTEHALYFLAAVIVMSQCAHVITHSGNGGMFLCLYRGGMHNVHQFMVASHIY